MAFALVGSVVALVAAWLTDRRRRLYADLGTTPAAAVYAGRNEIKGRAWHERPLRSHMTGTSTVWWTYLLEEEQRHTRTVTQTDSKGRTTTRTETYTEWHKIESLAGARDLIDIVDDSGSARVSLADATITSRRSAQETFTEDDGRGFLEKLFTADNRTGKYRRTEHIIAMGDELYVVGEASLPDGESIPQIDHGDPFLVSTRSEESHRRVLGAVAPLLLLVALGLAALGGNAVGGKAGLGGAVGAVVAVILGAATMIVFNRIQLLVQHAARAWSLIDIQLTRRHDLIPRLATVARAATDHERVVLESVINARSSLRDDAPDQATIDRADTEIRQQTDRLRTLFAVIEDYPELKTDESMRLLQNDLADTENRIAGARTFYNDAVTILRNRRGTFPGLLIARFADPRRFALFTAPGFERTVPKFEFDFDIEPVE